MKKSSNSPNEVERIEGKEERIMSNFVLDVSGNKGTRVAVLTISLHGGWDWLGAGHNSGGSWEWIHSEEDGFSIGLRDKKDNIFGFVSANWKPLPSPDGHPPKPWFSDKGVNSGTVTVVILDPSQTGNWKLRMNNSNGNKSDWKPRR